MAFTRVFFAGSVTMLWLLATACQSETPNQVAVSQPLSKIRIARAGRTFVTDRGKPFVPFGVTYYRPGTGWAPQVWKQFDPEATRSDFARMKPLGINCARVFLSYGSFYTDAGVLRLEGVTKFDQFLAFAEAAGIYVHPSGPDDWEGPPNWRPVTVQDEQNLRAWKNSGSSLPRATAEGTSFLRTT